MFVPSQHPGYLGHLLRRLASDTPPQRVRSPTRMSFLRHYERGLPGEESRQVRYYRSPKLQCWIPAELHHWLKVKAVDGRTNMTALVIEALDNYRRERES